MIEKLPPTADSMQGDQPLKQVSGTQKKFYCSIDLHQISRARDVMKVTKNDQPIAGSACLDSSCVVANLRKHVLLDPAAKT